MAQKRMFNKSITNSSRFLMMSLSAQALYFHLGMNADDDGFCEHFTVMRMTESKPDDLKILQAKGFIHVFDDRILIIRDWKENNNIRHDRYTPSKYLEEYKKEILALSECHTVGIPDDNQRYTQIRLDKVSIDTDKIKKETFSKPSISEIKEYLTEQHITSFLPEQFFDFYESKGWMIGKNKMKNWKAAIRTWGKNNTEKKDQKLFRNRDPFWESLTEKQKEELKKTGMLK